MEELARPDEALEPAVAPEASVEDNPETDAVDNPENNPAVDTETIEESLSALDLEPKEEPDFEAEPEPVAEASEPPAVESASSSVFAPVFVQHFDNFVDEEVPPPPTSPYLAAEGAALGAPTTGHVRTGHTPAGPSQPARKRGNKAGKAKQTSKLIKRWQTDFDRLANWLYRETGFDLRYFHHAQANPEFIWTLKVFKSLLEYGTPNQILVQIGNIFPPYRNWALSSFHLTGIGLYPTGSEDTKVLVIIV